MPSIVVGSLCLATIAVLLVTSNSRAGDRWLLPSFVGLLWATSVFAFIESFRGVPDSDGGEAGLYAKLKRRIRRGGYWVLGVVFFGATVVATVLTRRLVSIWLSEYAG